MNGGNYSDGYIFDYFLIIMMVHDGSDRDEESDASLLSNIKVVFPYDI